MDTHVTLTVDNLGKDVSPDELKTFLCPDKKRLSGISVQLGLQRTDKHAPLAVVKAPRTYAKRMLAMNGKELKGQAINIYCEEDTAHSTTYKCKRWKKLENGVSQTSPVGGALRQTGSATQEEPIPFRYAQVDGGVYLADPTFDHNVEEVIQRAQLSGTQKMVALAHSLPETRRGRNLSTLFPGQVYFTAGVLPYYEDSLNDGWEKRLTELAADPNCVAIGEVGLDFESANTRRQNKTPCSDQDKDWLIEVFGKQVEIASILNKPLMVFESGAHKEVVEILESRSMRTDLPICIKSLTQTEEDIEDYLSRGYYLCMTGNTFCRLSSRLSGMQKWLTDMADRTVLDRLLLASNAPACQVFQKHSYVYFYKWDYPATQTSKALAYTNFREKFHEPIVLPVVTELAAAIVGLSAEDMAETCARNAHTFFRFDDKPDLHLKPNCDRQYAIVFTIVVLTLSLMVLNFWTF